MIKKCVSSRISSFLDDVRIELENNPNPDMERFIRGVDEGRYRIVISDVVPTSRFSRNSFDPNMGTVFLQKNLEISKQELPGVIEELLFYTGNISN